MKVLLFAALREAAGTAHVDVEASTVGELLDELSTRFGPAFERVARVGAVVVNGQTVGRGHRLQPNDEVAMLPPVSGG